MSGSSKSRRMRRSHARVPRVFETLEDRRLLAITVNTLVDELDGSITDGDVSLRDALLAHAPLETINFAPELFAGGPATLVLTRGELRVTKDVTIEGPGSDMLAIDASGNDFTPFSRNGDGTRAFNVTSAGGELDVRISGLLLTGGDASGPGGAIRNTENLTLRDVDLVFNWSQGDGGAVFNTGVLTVIASTLASNYAPNGLGGAVYAAGPSLTIQQSTLGDNHARHGGAIAIAGAPDGETAWLITDSALIANAADQAGGGDGGALHAAAGAGRISNSTISGNQAYNSGGGLWLGAGVGRAIVSHSTVANNAADVDFNGVGLGGGLLVNLGVNASLFNSIVAPNYRSGVASDVAGPVSATYSLLGVDTGAFLNDLGANLIGTGASPIDPLLGGLNNYGGPTLTHELLPGSPAINAGDAGGIPGAGVTPLFDQRGEGFSRASIGRMDIGAFEVEGVTIRGQKWHDLNEDGVKDAGEPGLPGWTIYLDVNDNDVLDVGEVSTVTDSGGLYEFAELPPGAYTVAEVIHTGWFQSSPTTGSLLDKLNLNHAAITSLVPTRYDFFEGDFGFWIEDGGGDMYDGGNILNTNLATFIPYTTGVMTPSDAMFGPGSSYFTAKYPGLFAMGAFNVSINEFSLAGNLGADGGGIADGAVLSTTVNGRPYTIYLKRVYNTSDPSVNEIIMVPGNGAGLSRTFATNTDDGAQRITGMASVDEFYYALVARASGQVLSHADVLNVANAFLANLEKQAGPHRLVLASGDEAIADFGNYIGPASISGRKWSDNDADGEFDAGEPVLAGWTMYLDLDRDGALDAGEPTAVTDADGVYRFDDLDPGLYAVAEVPQVGWNQTFPHASFGSEVVVFDNGDFVDTLDLIDSESDNVQATLASFGATVTTFTGLTGPEWAAALAGASIVVIPELENSGLVGSLTPEAVTVLRDFVQSGGGLILNGAHSVSGRAADLLNQVFGYSLVEFNVSGSFTRGAAAAGTEFSDDVPTLPWANGTSGLVLTSLPAGALPIYSDSSFAGVALFTAGAGQIAYLGYDWFDAAPRGSQDFGWVEVLRSAYQETAALATLPGAHAVRLGPGENRTEVDFGNTPLPGSVRGQKWNDVDRDGVLDAGEPGLPGWTIFLDANNNGVLDAAPVSLDPDGFAPGTALNTIRPGVTLSQSNTSGLINPSTIISAAAVGELLASTGSQAFGNSFTGSGVWAGSTRLRVDFATPVDSVSIDVISDDASDVGSFQAFSSTGVLLASLLSPALSTGNFHTFTATSAARNIAYILVGGRGSSDAMLIDNLVYTGSETSAVTDGDGFYFFPDLPAGEHVLGEVAQSGWVQTYPIIGAGSTAVVFDNPSFVDTGNTVSAESDALQASLVGIGASVRTFAGLTAADWSAALVGATALVIPELEVNDLAPALTPEVRAVIRNYVDAGGGLIVMGSHYTPGHAANFLNAVFGTTVTEQNAFSSYNRTAAAAGTEFADEAASLPPNEGTSTLAVSSLPAGARVIYGSATQAAVVLTASGNGSIAYLGWDWSNAAPLGTQNNGWLGVLESAYLEVGQSGAIRHAVTVGAGQAVIGVNFGSYLAATPATMGDFDQNGRSDGNDFLLWQQSLGTAVAPGSGSDGNANGVVDGGDLPHLTANFGYVAEIAANASVAEASAVTASLEHSRSGALADEALGALADWNRLPAPATPSLALKWSAVARRAAADGSTGYAPASRAAFAVLQRVATATESPRRANDSDDLEGDEASTDDLDAAFANLDDLTGA